MDKTFVVNGCNNHSDVIRQSEDYYATPYVATEKLLEHESFSDDVLEPFVGGGHIARILEEHGHKVRSSDIVDRGWHDTEIVDFLECDETPVDADIISNPPYKFAARCWEKACRRVTAGHKVAFMMKLTFLEGQERQEMFREYPPSRILVFSKRITCAINGEFEKFKSSAVAYAWFIYEAGNSNLPLVSWI